MKTKETKMKALKVVKDPENVIPVEVFEQAIVDLAKGFKKLNSSRLSKRAVVLLVQDSVGAPFVNRSQVEAILDAAADLDRKYLKK